MPTKKGSRAEESSNISSRTAQSNHLPQENITQRGDNATIEEFNGLNINETDHEQKQFSKNNSGDFRDEDTSLKNQSEAGPDIAEFTEEEFKSAVECELLSLILSFYAKLLFLYSLVGPFLLKLNFLNIQKNQTVAPGVFIFH